MLAGIPNPVGTFAHLKRAVDFGASDGEPADLVVLLLVPDDNTALLLRALSCVTRRLRDKEVAKRRRGEISAAAAYVILTTDSWRGNDPYPNTKQAA
jgi:PTS system nitrogen regulatory IIA component